MKNTDIFKAIGNLPADMIAESALPERRLRDRIAMLDLRKTAWAAAVILCIGLNVFAVYGIAKTSRRNLSPADSEDVTAVRNTVSEYVGKQLDAVLADAEAKGITKISKWGTSSGSTAENTVMQANLSWDNTLSLIYSTGPVRMYNSTLQFAMTDDGKRCFLNTDPVMPDVYHGGSAIYILVQAADDGRDLGCGALGTNNLSSSENVFSIGGRLEQYCTVLLNSQNAGNFRGRATVKLIMYAHSGYSFDEDAVDLQVCAGTVNITADADGTPIARAEDDFDFPGALRKLESWCSLHEDDGHALVFCTPFDIAQYRSSASEFTLTDGKTTVSADSGKQSRLEFNLIPFTESGMLSLQFRGETLCTLRLTVTGTGYARTYHLLDDDGKEVRDSFVPIKFPSVG